MSFRRVKSGEQVPTILLPDDSVPGTVDDNQLSNEERPHYWQSGDGTVDMPYFIIAQPSDINWRMGADELRDMAREMAKDSKTSGLREEQAIRRSRFNDALVRGLEKAKSEYSHKLLKRLQF